MMRYTEEGETLKDKSRCSILRANLKMCLLDSNCCKIKKFTPRQCLLRKDETVPEECFLLHQAFFECKRSVIDARTRFRGPKTC